MAESALSRQPEPEAESALGAAPSPPWKERRMSTEAGESTLTPASVPEVSDLSLGVLVGVDGSPESRLALAWAMDEALSRGTGLTVLAVWHVYPLAEPTDVGSTTWFTADPAAATGQYLSHVVEDVRAQRGTPGATKHSAADLTVRQLIRSGRADDNLVELSAKAEVVVVGARGHGLSGLLVGSTSTSLVQRSACTVVVPRSPRHASRDASRDAGRGLPSQPDEPAPAPPDPAAGPARSGQAGDTSGDGHDPARTGALHSGPDRARVDDHTLVVGVDGSPESVAALEWACTEARLRHLTVVVVAVWNIVPVTVEPLLGTAAYAAADAERTTRQTLRRLVVEAAERHPDVEIAGQVAVGHPAEQLMAIGAPAAMLVVGAVGHGGFLGMMMGSTSRTVLAHSHTTVVVVR
ncbi:universal stress protein [Terracoccus luteus]|nr:universal stress protein [Terracoccus luteus]